MIIKKNQQYSSLRTSLVVSSATILLRIIGLLREVALASAYGAGIISDAFVIATAAPGILLVIINTAITAVYVPQYTNAKGDRNRFTSNLLTLLCVIGFFFALIFTIFPQGLVFLFASNVAPETFTLAVKLLQIMIWSAVPILLVGIFRGFLQIKKVFFIAMGSEGLVNLFVIISIISGKLTGFVLLMGIGTVIGNVASISLLAIVSIRKGLVFRPRLDMLDPYVKEMLILMLPIILSSAVLEINQVINKNLASSLVSGTVSAMNYAEKVNGIMVAVIGTSIGIALFPKMSELAADGDIATIKKHLVMNMNALYPLILPLTVGITLMAVPAIRLILERGSFNTEDTKRTAECLRMYTLGLLAANLTQLVTRVFYSLREVKWPAILSAIALTVGIALNLLLIGPLKHQGLAFATSVSTTLGAILQIVVLRRKIGTLGLSKHLREFGKVTLASALMGIMIWVAMQFVPITTGTYMQCFMWTIIVASGGVLLYGTMLVVLRAEIVAKIYSQIKNRNRMKLSNI